ncbi:MAG: hypothetical protein ABFS42_04365 [Candidatus Krumholzibacteriota bacterium]
MKTAISLPDELFEAAERVARRLGLSRSELYQRALAKFIESQNSAAITSELDEVYSAENRGRLDPVLDGLQRASLVREDW